MADTSDDIHESRLRAEIGSPAADNPNWGPGHNYHASDVAFLLRRLDEVRARRPTNQLHIWDGEGDSGENDSDVNAPPLQDWPPEEYIARLKKVIEAMQAVTRASMQDAHDARVTELLEANTREVERRRTVEAERDRAIEVIRSAAQRIDNTVAQTWRVDNKTSLGEYLKEASEPDAWLHGPMTGAERASARKAFGEPTDSPAEPADAAPQG